MKKKIKFFTTCLLVGIFLSSCALLGEREKCPAYSKAKTIENTPNAKECVKI